MPIYEYKCKKCGEITEILVRRESDEKSVSCKKCGSKKLEKIFSLFSSGGGCSSCSSEKCTTST